MRQDELIVMIVGFVTVFILTLVKALGWAIESSKRDEAAKAKAAADRDRVSWRNISEGAGKAMLPAPQPAYGRSRLEAIRATYFPTVNDSTWRDLRRIDGIPKPGDRYPSLMVNAVASTVAVDHGMDGKATVKVEYTVIEPVTRAWDDQPRTFSDTFKVTGFQCDHAGNPSHAVYCGKCGRMMDNPLPIPPPAPGLILVRRSILRTVRRIELKW